VRRHERERPGELIHIDIRKLGKFNQIGHLITGDRTGQSNGRGVVGLAMRPAASGVINFVLSVVGRMSFSE
jgi:hypothetical protein